MVNIKDLLEEHFEKKLDKWEMQNAIMCVKTVLADEEFTAEIVINYLYPQIIRSCAT